MANAEYEIDHAVIADLLKNDVTVWAELYAVGEDAKQFWVDIAPVNKYGDESAGEPHTLESGYVDEPGSYRDSIRMRMMKNPTRMKCRVEAVDYKVFWLEGVHSVNAHNDPPPEPMLHTLAHLKSLGLSFGGDFGEGAE